MLRFCGNMGQTNSNMISEIKAWFVEKWKWIVGVFAGILALAIALYKRDAFYKKNFENIKQNAEAEKKIVEDSAKELVDKTEKITEEAKKSHEAIVVKNEKAVIELEKTKKDFLDEAKESDTLAEDIAKELGVDFVKTE